MLRGEHFILRQVREQDLDEFLRLSNDFAVRGEFWPGGLMAEVRSRNDYKETGWWEENKGTLLITDKTDRMLGKLFFWKSVTYLDAFELGGIIFRTEDRGKGIMSEVLPLLIAWLFETRRIDRVQATHLLGNEASKAVLLKAGMTYEGTLRRAVFHKGESRDLAMYAILRGEEQPLKALLVAVV